MRFFNHKVTHHLLHDSSRRTFGLWQRPEPKNTQHSHETDVHAPGGIRTHNCSKSAAADLRLQTAWPLRMAQIPLPCFEPLTVEFVESHFMQPTPSSYSIHEILQYFPSLMFWSPRWSLPFMSSHQILHKFFILQHFLHVPTVQTSFIWCQKQIINVAITRLFSKSTVWSPYATDILFSANFFTNKPCSSLIVRASVTFMQQGVASLYFNLHIFIFWCHIMVTSCCDKREIT